MQAEKIREALLMDESRIQEELLKRVSAYISLDSKGRVHLRDPGSYTQKDRAALYLIGARFAADAGLRESPSVSLTELAEGLGASSTTLAARLMELKNEGKIGSETRGEYSVVFARAPWILTEIEATKVKPT